MLFMNDWDIQRAVDQGRGLRGEAARILYAHRNVINANSDGWAYWQPPVRAAKKLMELIQSPAEPTERGLKAALVPIKSFYSRHPDLPRPMPLVDKVRT
jgi:hypothetical protein